MDVPDVAVTLFAGEPRTFVARRDELAKRLKGEGRMAEAARVKRLRRPTAAADAINRMVREAPEQLDDVVAAASALASAQRRALSGVSGTDLRGATRAHNAAIDALMTALPDADALPVATRDDVRRTLHAAALDEDLAALVAAGALSTAADAPDASMALTGFGALSVVPQPVEEEPDGGEEAEARRRDQVAEERALAERAAMRARAAVDEGRAVHSAALARATTATAAAAEAVSMASHAEGAAREAMRRAETLADAARSAESAAASAAANVEDLADAVGWAERDLARREAALADALTTVEELSRKA